MSDFGKLPVENVVDILARLSVTSLGRCRCVCKSWRSLIADPIFINEQLRINRDRRRIDGDHHHYSYITYSNIKCSTYVFSYSSSYHSLRCSETCREHKQIGYPWLIGICTVTSSCNGILCLLHRHQISFGYDIILWNPLIKKIKILPKPRFQTSPNFDESVAIGFVPQANEYKVVHLNLARNWEVSSPQKIEIYSLGKDSWRTWTGEDIQWRLLGDTANESVNGSIYWKARKNVYNSDSRLIVSFHLADEVFKEISLPKCHRARPNRKVGFISVSIIYEKLAFSIARGSETPNEEEVLEVWVLEESYGTESWTKFRNIIFPTGQYKVPSFSFSTSEICNVASRILENYEPTRFIENGEFSVHDSWNNRLIVLDPKTQQIVAKYGSKFKVVNCTESLVLLNEGIDISSREMWKFAREFAIQKREEYRKMKEEERRKEEDRKKKEEEEEEELGIAGRVIKGVMEFFQELWDQLMTWGGLVLLFRQISRQIRGSASDDNVG